MVVSKLDLYFNIIIIKIKIVNFNFIIITTIINSIELINFIFIITTNFFNVNTLIIRKIVNNFLNL